MLNVKRRIEKQVGKSSILPTKSLVSNSENYLRQMTFSMYAHEIKLEKKIFANKSPQEFANS